MVFQYFKMAFSLLILVHINANICILTITFNYKLQSPKYCFILHCTLLENISNISEVQDISCYSLFPLF